MVTTFADHHQLFELGTRGSKIGKDWFQLLEWLVPRTGNPWFHGWAALVRMLGKPAVPRAGNPWFQDWEALVTTFADHHLFELGTRGSMIGKDWFQLLESLVPRTENLCSSSWEPVVPRLGSIGYNFFGPSSVRAGNPWFHDWE